MSSENPARAFGPPTTTATVSFALGASGAVPAVSAWRGANEGAFTVARSAAGQYTVTWDSRFKGNLLDARVTAFVGDASGDPTITQSVALGLPDRTVTTRTVKFSTLTSGSVADLASGSQLTITLVFHGPQS